MFSQPQQIRDCIKDIVEIFGQTMFGLDDVARLCLIAFYSDGHVLLEGNPGQGKTELVKGLSRILNLEFGRIQFTPDLMPSDITGTKEPQFLNGGLTAFEFVPGPILKHQLLLGDEINRATPKTQAAMLEAMAERRVTVLGQEYRTKEPFMVLATQNPIEHEGTYLLPEAQLDRFMFHIEMPPPTSQSIQAILRKTTGASSSSPGATAESSLPRSHPTLISPEASWQVFREIRKQIREVRPSVSLEQHIQNLLFAFMGAESSLTGDDPKSFRQACALLRELSRYPIGPRAAIALMTGAKAWHLLFGGTGEFASTSELKRVVVPALRHRMKLDFSWREKVARDLKLTENHPDLLELFVLHLCSLTGPDKQSRSTFQERFEELRTQRVGG
ncbi:MAG: AAA family ATPase [Planctomycetaceae bacterium]